MNRPNSPASAVLAGAILLATILVGCASPQFLGGPSDLLSPSDAVRVVRDYWAINERAAMSHDLNGFARVETGLLLEADRGEVQANQAMAVPPIRQPRPLRKVTAYVPHQRHLPAEFLALLETVQVDEASQLTDQPEAIYLHFVRSSEREPWKADFYAFADIAHPVHLAHDPAGYATVVPTGAGGWVLRPGDVSGAYVSYMESGLSSGIPSGSFGPGNWTTGSVSVGRAYHTRMNQAGLAVTEYYLDRQLVQAYRAADGAAIVLYAVEPASIVTAPPGICLDQPADHLSRWGGLVPAGSYSSIGVHDLLEMVAEDQVARPGAVVNVLSAADDQVSAATQPAPGC
jgi:hypothetical protein